jgi:hypothetical protein
MSDLEAVNEIEYAHLNRRPGEAPTLYKSYDLLLSRWTSGDRNRETTLRLLFLSWLSYSEANFLTGLEPAPPRLLVDLLRAIDIDHTSDEETLFVLHTMLQVCGDLIAHQHPQLAELIDRNEPRIERKFRIVAPSIFVNRRAYGQYFAHQATFQAEWDGTIPSVH